MNYLVKVCQRYGIFNSDIDYHVLRASMVLIFLFFGYQKWFEYEAQALIPYISNGPLIAWMYPVFGVRGACWFLRVSEWTFGALLFIGFWNKTAGFLMKDFALLAVSFYLLKQDLLRLSLAQHQETTPSAAAPIEISSEVDRKIA